ncbi:hypothetical protein WOLCODRAFT_162759 [Wolfiporia cocos MD-104 SS10]|uniref:Rpr2-domain-containing protein n=1 Tax=Wolfiporia cocos (strain MD-104) TaxID=742152 RepID=A0A2H3JFS1_WOLCO|nr:hypothetical protein WOLCODRAFT_162759 [Wolfiporia cocos MD-104 SS10]
MQAVAPATTPAATLSFQLAIPFVLAPVAPSVAALHALRAPDAPAALRPTHCPACGAAYFLSGGRVRSTRTRKRPRTHTHRDEPAPSTRAVRMSCGACGYEDVLPLEGASASAAVFPQPRKRRALLPPDASSGAAADQKKDAGVAGALAREPTRVAPPQPRQPSDAPASSRASPSSQVLPRPPHHPSSNSSSKSDPLSKSAPPISKSLPSAATPAPARSKARPKKSAGLQGLLARNREKQEREKQEAKYSVQGLSSFLQELG